MDAEYNLYDAAMDGLPPVVNGIGRRASKLSTPPISQHEQDLDKTVATDTMRRPVDDANFNRNRRKDRRRRRKTGHRRTKRFRNLYAQQTNNPKYNVSKINDPKARKHLYRKTLKKTKKLCAERYNTKRKCVESRMCRWVSGNEKHHGYCRVRDNQFLPNRNVVAKNEFARFRHIYGPPKEIPGRRERRQGDRFNAPTPEEDRGINNRVIYSDATPPASSSSSSSAQEASAPVAA